LRPLVTPPRSFINREAAEYLGISPRTLEKLRQTGGGPKFRKIGSAVRYLEADLQDFLDRAARINTSQGAA